MSGFRLSACARRDDAGRICRIQCPLFSTLRGYVKRVMARCRRWLFS
ncbi:Hypothetical protein ETEE_3033 [Edwardsiella anguillarum ET080813]|uniref:Uncharacterized protein n=1 Tax=Edwardsiella anguillarum ET080813 TaxID=667120 RepID=A0A076LS30_9GAMM|nr:Hypothetical protein ETEE_3033 [Edwardsiella anguillarum ET080813]